MHVGRSVQRLSPSCSPLAAAGLCGIAIADPTDKIGREMASWGFWLTVGAGFSLSVVIETPVLMLGLSNRHTWRTRLFAGIWLTACTYPIVAVGLPSVMDVAHSRFWYTLTAETFAPLAECLLFCLVFARGGASRGQIRRDCTAIVVANLASFGLGLLLMPT